MAAIYTRIYTYAGQNKWTADARSAAFGSFAVSGDTGRNIGQIVSIQYEHSHSSTSSRDWALTGRLVLDDGTMIDSAPVTQRISKNTVVKFVNAFATLPAAEQFARIATVQTLDGDGSATNNGVLTWRADAERPLRIIVSFYEQPPTKYAPQITNFSVERVTANNQPSLEGSYISTTLKLSLTADAPVNEAKLTLYTSTNPGAAGTATDLSSKISALLGGAELDTSIITGQYSAGSTFYFTLVFAIGSESTTAEAQAYRARAPIHITNNGASFGGFSSATEDDPKEEFHNPVVFYKGFSMGGGNDVLTGIGLQHGRVNSMTVTASTTNTLAVTFPVAFASAPDVVATFDSTNVDSFVGRWDYLTLTVYNVTATGFTLRVHNGTSTTFTPGVRWMAIGTPG